MAGKREDYISWDEYFMGIAFISSLRSKDPRTQVGACIVDTEKHILSTGYNGAPLNLSDDDLPWDSLGEATNDIMNIKNTFVCHAEANAIDNYNGNKDKLKNSTIYVTLFPCVECAKRIIQNKIKKVVYLKQYSKQAQINAANYMFEKANVEIQQFDIEGLYNLKNSFLKKQYNDFLKIEYKEKTKIKERGVKYDEC